MSHLQRSASPLSPIAPDDILKAGTGLSHGSQFTKGWTRVKEGYLIKTKVVRGLHKSHKLRYFVLYQHPQTKQAQLEYYAGKTLKGSANLVGARAIPLPAARFELYTPTRLFLLSAEQGDVEDAATWTFALQKAIDECSAVMEVEHPGRRSSYVGEMAGLLRGLAKLIYYLILANSFSLVLLEGGK
jgi:hypothetical protein